MVTRCAKVYSYNSSIVDFVIMIIDRLCNNTCREFLFVLPLKVYSFQAVG